MASGSHSAVTSGPALESALGALLQAWPAHAIEPALTHLVATCLKSQVVSDDRLIELERAHAEMQARRLALESALPVQSGSMRAAVATIRQAAFDGSVSPQLEEAWSQVQTVALPLICQAKIRRGTNVRGEKIDKAKLESQSLALAAWLKDASNPMSPPPSRYLAGDEMCGRDRYPGFSALSVPPRRDLVRLWLSELLAMGDAFSRESYTPLTVHILLVEMDLQRQLRHHQLGIDSSLSSTSGRVISLLPLEQPIQREAADAWVSDLCRTGRVDARPKVVLGCMSVHLGPNGQGIWTAYQLDDSAMEATLYSWDHGYEITDRTRDVRRKRFVVIRAELILSKCRSSGLSWSV